MLLAEGEEGSFFETYQSISVVLHKAYPQEKLSNQSLTELGKCKSQQQPIPVLYVGEATFPSKDHCCHSVPPK
jgi:hypothetical protein